MSQFIGLSASVARSVAARERVELMRRVRCYRGARSIPDVAGRTVVVVDDGLPTGAPPMSKC